MALGVEVGEGVKEGVERREVGVQALDMSALVINVAVEARDGEGEGVECEGEVVGFVGKGAAEEIFDAAVWLVRLEASQEGVRTLELFR